MNKLLSVLLASVFATAMVSSAFAAEPVSKEDAVKAPTANAAPMKQKHAHKAHKSHKTEKAPSAPEAAK
jgi:hypothetical protein